MAPHTGHGWPKRPCTAISGRNAVTFAGNPFSVKNVEFSFSEWRGHLVLYDFASGARANHAIAFLDGLNAANVETD